MEHKEPLAHLTLRLPPTERDALVRHAEQDHRTVSALVRKILVEWLRKQAKARP